MATVDFLTADCIEWMNDQPADRFDLVFGSPPYCDARTYGIGAQRDCVQWVEWMLEVTTAASRICKGPVIWVAAGVTRKRNYWPACEGLMWEWWKRGGEHQLYRPCCYQRQGIPGSGGDDYLRADWEYAMCFKRPGRLPYFDVTAVGWPCKYKTGGAFSYRTQDGQRVNEKKHNRGSGAFKANGNGACRKGRPDTTNPGNIVRCKVGGGHMGDDLAHENEAPFPEALAEFFVRGFCPPEGLCLDPFSGSGTTASVCQQWGRNCIGVDLRESQTELGRRRTSQRLLV